MDCKSPEIKEPLSSVLTPTIPIEYSRIWNKLNNGSKKQGFLTPLVFFFTNFAPNLNPCLTQKVAFATRIQIVNINENTDYMEIISLREKLIKEGEIYRSIIVSSALIKDLEIYGFINCAIQDSKLEINTSDYIVCANLMRYHSDIIPLFRSISICTEDIELKVKNVHIPSLQENTLYKSIHERFGTEKIVQEYEFKKAKWPAKYRLEDGDVMFPVEKGTVVFKDKDGCIKSVEEDALVLCRYIYNDTGDLKYMIFALDQLYCEEKTNKRPNK